MRPHHGAAYSSPPPFLCCIIREGLDYLISSRCIVLLVPFSFAHEHLGRHVIARRNASRYAHVLLACPSFTNKQTSFEDSPFAYHVQNLGTHALHASKVLYQHQGWQYPWLWPIWTHHKGRKREWMRSSTTTTNESGTWTEGEGKWSISWDLPVKESNLWEREQGLERQAQPVWQVFMM